MHVLHGVLFGHHVGVTPIFSPQNILLTPASYLLRL